MSVQARQSNARNLLKPEVLASLKTLDLVARSAVEGLMIGLHRSPTFGFSQEFAEYKLYAEGDDTRCIDWNVYSRTGQTYIKRFLGDTNSHLTVLLDCSASMGFGEQPVNKLQYAKFLAASLAYLANRQHDAVGVMTFDDQVREYRQPSTRAGMLQTVLHTIDEATATRGTDLGRPLQQFLQTVPKKGLVAIISDFYCDSAMLLDAVRPLAWQGQDVVLFQILSAEEMSPDTTQNTLFEDVESGEVVEVSPGYLQQEYPQKLQRHIDGLAQLAGRVGADHCLIRTDDLLDKALRAYLQFRNRRK